MLYSLLQNSAENTKKYPRAVECCVCARVCVCACVRVCEMYACSLSVSVCSCLCIELAKPSLFPSLPPHIKLQVAMSPSSPSPSGTAL